MYTRITHTIVEEHFANQNGTMEVINSFKPQEKVKVSYLNVNPANRFQMISRTYWSRFLWRFRSLLVAITDNHASQGELATNLYKDISNIANLVRQYWGDGEADMFETSFKDVVTSSLQIVKTIRLGQEFAPLKAQLAVVINQFAEVVSQLNPQSWLAADIELLWSEVCQEWVNQASARSRRDWSRDMQSVNLVQELLIDGVPGGALGFADQFSSGIIAKFPNKFEG